MSKITSAFKFINNPNAKMSILTSNVDKEYLSELSKANHVFYSTVREDTVDEVYTIKGDFRAIEFDLMIMSGRFNPNAEDMVRLSKLKGTPLIILDSTYSWNFSKDFSSIEDIPKRFYDTLKQNNADMHVYPCKEMEESWSFFCSNNVTIPYNNVDYTEEKFAKAWDNIFKEIEERI